VFLARLRRLTGSGLFISNRALVVSPGLSPRPRVAVSGHRVKTIEVAGTGSATTVGEMANRAMTDCQKFLVGFGTRFSDRQSECNPRMFVPANAVRSLCGTGGYILRDAARRVPRVSRPSTSRRAIVARLSAKRNAGAALRCPSADPGCRGVYGRISPAGAGPMAGCARTRLLGPGCGACLNGGARCPRSVSP
jgi:hypothetical protein